jgi:hypothetical protein
MKKPRHVLLLNGSPKAGASASRSIGAYLLGRLVEAGCDTASLHVHTAVRSDSGSDALLAAVDTTDLVVFASPLYFDSLPAPTIRAMEVIAEHRRHRGAATRPGLLAIVNSGFPEPDQNSTALAICRLFARDAGFDWIGGLPVGGGGMVGAQPLREMKGRLGRLVRALDLTATAIANGQRVPDEALQLLARPPVSARLYACIADFGFRRQARRKGVADRLKARPYLER